MGHKPDDVMQSNNNVILCVALADDGAWCHYLLVNHLLICQNFCTCLVWSTTIVLRISGQQPNTGHVRFN